MPNHFWSTPRKGTNIFNKVIHAQDIRAAKKYGIQFIRLAPDRFPSLQRDFLIGNADDFKALVKADFVLLKHVLDMCWKEKMPVVITMLSLPGARWKQKNGGRNDLRIWRQEKLMAQAALFWQELAKELKDHPAVVGYNLLNEPYPERMFFFSGPIYQGKKYQKEVQSLLHHLYALIIKSIRLVDPYTPIILDSSAYADAQSFAFLKPHSDQYVLYSFHMYEPYEYTNWAKNHSHFSYPGSILGQYWNREKLEKHMAAVVAFQKAHHIASDKILVGEFGGHRMSRGLDQYFKDLIDIFKKNGWHFAFYAFREDVWDGMDYELGDQKFPWAYWQAVAKGKNPPMPLKRTGTHPAFSVIRKALGP